MTLSSRMRGSRLRAAAALATGAIAGVVLAAGTAYAHVETDPGTVARGDDGLVSIRVPNEESGAGVVKVTVAFPQDHPIAEVQTSPVAGWTAEVAKGKLPKPVHQNNADYDEAVTTVTWTADRGAAITPEQFRVFPMLVGPIPDNTDELTLPVTQTYDNGDTVVWDQPEAAPGAPEAEHPAPTVKIVDGAMGAAAPAAAVAPDGTARLLGGLGLVLDGLGLIVLVALAIVLIRRRRSDPVTPTRDTAGVGRK